MDKIKTLIIFLLLIVTSFLFYFDQQFEDKKGKKTVSKSDIFFKNYKEKNTVLQKPAEPISLILEKNKDLYTRLDSLFLIMKFNEEWIEDSFQDSIWIKKVTVPKSLSLIEYHKIILNLLKDLNLENINVTENSQQNCYIYRFPIKKNLQGKIIVKRSAKIKEKYYPFGRIALVIDDFGNQWKTDYIQGYLEFPVPVTLAIIPGHWASTRTAKKAKELGKEIMIHFPMQPYKGDITKEKVYLTTEMKTDQIKKMLIKAMSSVPYAKGLNNHEGSLATSDAGTMSRFFSVYKDYKMFFLNSLTSSKSIARTFAENDSVKYLERNIFLDDKMTEEEITAKFKIAASRAINGKDVVAIGHARKMTFEVLKRLITDEYQNLTYVFASEMVK